MACWMPWRRLCEADMAGEGDFIALMRTLAGTDGARGLLDDVAVLGDLVLTTDTLVEGVHYLPDDPADSVGWKLAAVNLSDLAAKGAQPVGCLLNYALTDDASGEAAWEAGFARGLDEALRKYAMPLLGGDTVRMPPGAPRSLSLTAIGRCDGAVPTRAGAQAGDELWVTGPVGDAGAGLDLLRAGLSEPAELVAACRRPQPRLDHGRRWAPHAHASMDISDGLLLDAQRMGEASGLAVIIDHVPVSGVFAAQHGRSTASLLRAATAGDDYELLFALPPGARFGVPPDEHDGLIRIGRFEAGAGLRLVLDGEEVPLPARLGWEHN